MLNAQERLVSTMALREAIRQYAKNIGATITTEGVIEQASLWIDGTRDARIDNVTQTATVLLKQGLDEADARAQL